MRWHLIEGEDGCEFAVKHHCVAVVVDALRASSTAAQLLHEGAQEIMLVRTIEEAIEAKGLWPDALLYGERGGLPPAGFDYGNSPLEASYASDRRVIFSTTTGAGRMVSAWGAQAVYLGAVINATQTVHEVIKHGCDIVLIPAGLSDDDNFDAQEDWTGAVAIALAAGPDIQLGEGREQYDFWKNRIESEGILNLFATAPHADKLRAIGMENDIVYCARKDIINTVPRGMERNPWGIITRTVPHK